MVTLGLVLNMRTKTPELSSDDKLSMPHLRPCYLCFLASALRCSDGSHSTQNLAATMAAVGAAAVPTTMAVAAAELVIEGVELGVEVAAADSLMEGLEVLFNTANMIASERSLHSLPNFVFLCLQTCVISNVSAKWCLKTEHVNTLTYVRVAYQDKASQLGVMEDSVRVLILHTSAARMSTWQRHECRTQLPLALAEGCNRCH